MAAVLVTGGAGFIGANLCRHLVGRGHRCVVLDDFSTGDIAALDGVDIEIHQGDVRDGAAVAAAMDGVDAVVHLAAVAGVPPSLTDPVGTGEVNVGGTIQVLDAARRQGCHVVVASSAAVYGPDPAVPTTADAPLAPASPYAASKVAAEQYALAFARSFDLAVTPLRFFNVYGPGQTVHQAYAAVVPAFIDAALAGRPLTIHGDGQQTRDFVEVQTVCDVLSRVVEGRRTSDIPVNVAVGQRHSILEVAAVLEEILGAPLDRTHTPAVAGDVRHSAADHRPLAGLVGDLEVVDLHTGLARTLEWARRGR